MEKFINKIKIENVKKIAPLIIIIILIILIVNLYYENSNLKWQELYQRTIPDVELINYISFDSNNIVSGSLTGYVVFDNKEKQPSGLRQYIEITATKYKDDNGNQIFTEKDIIKMNAIPPKFFDPVILTLKDSSGSIISLSDANGNLFFIDKNTKEVKMIDKTGDVTKLITNESDFKDFIRSLQNN